MKLFISNTIHLFKTKSIPTNSLILPLQKYKINDAIRLIQKIKPSKIICETEEIFNLLNKKFNNIEVLNENTKCYSYFQNKLYQKPFYLLISSIITLILSFLLSLYSLIPLLIINLLIFTAIIICFNENFKWDQNFTRLVDF